ncbi:MobA/MobL family protein [Xanthomonas citri pv. anacardii]|uniref:MobA/MobL family protein n=1 Tax=Xanthomonas citri TaxID=346 RepID=UPI000CCBE9EB|nr:MobA/MobL family protein [Xanthomonas citri]MCT8358071.1 MobA/MobL family protein [Xanthomonas citri pv. anacardii]MCT8362129.1 MobA/MobL family protein [Xanthomonas citri pv. anacardii]MCT8366180.1 MobA/MobL family protein [Xanthomonas citri pv. anacardii]MCT8370204.1 MobA/MobL family protein [Xanthomonas citri pv. anacardii]MCT8374168.1 MobA/MobL family protein [Xanthomonas citri pv. anacardii]
MAIYHSRVKTFSRARGDSSVAAAAYRAGLLLVDHLTGRRHDYRHRGGVVETICLAPDGSPDWAVVPSELWPAAEVAENRKNSTVAREFELALPHELDESQRSELTAAIAEALVGRYGFALQASIHSPGMRDGLNHHAHLLATTRRMTPSGLGEKTRELDGGASGRGEIEWVRATVAELTNAHLAMAGVNARVDHRRLEVQAEDAMLRGDLVEAIALTRPATQHMGKNASALERRGVNTDRAAANEQIAEDTEALFEETIEQARREGRAVATPSGHSAEQASSERRRSTASYRVGAGLQIEGVSGVRAGALGLGARPSLDNEPPVASVEELVDEAVLELRDVLALSPALRLPNTERVVNRWVASLSTLADGPEIRRHLRAVIDRLLQLRRGLTSFARRVAAVTRAERLFNMAEQAWERFNADCPRPLGDWSAYDWEARRGRRLATLGKRATELKEARAGATDEVRAHCESEVLRRADALEHRCSELLVQWSMEDLPGTSSDSHPAPEPAHSPERRRPRPGGR